MPQALNPLCHTQVGRIPFTHFPGVINNWPSPAWKWKGGKLSEQNWLNRLQMAQFECPRPSTHWCHLLMKPSVCVVWAPFLPRFFFPCLASNGELRRRSQFTRLRSSASDVLVNLVPQNSQFSECSTAYFALWLGWVSSYIEIFYSISI